MRKLLVLCLGAALLLPACIKVDNSLGKSLVDKSLLYDTYTVEFPLEEIQLKYSDGLSGYSDTRLTVGAIFDEVFGLTTREAAFCLVPRADTLDLGTNPKAISFDLYFEADTVSCNDDSQARIFQNLYVTELLEPLPSTHTSCTQDIPHSDKLITEGVPVYNGDGPLAFYFTKEFAQKYVDVISKMGPVFRERVKDESVPHIDQYDEYISELPGIHIETDHPTTPGGRINLFKFSALSVSNNQYVRNSNIALLKVNSTWNGVQKDSTFLFVPGEPEFVDEVYYSDNNQKFYQYCFNRTAHTTLEGQATDHIWVEGGGGLKPVILARELQEKTSAAVAREGGKPDEAIIIKASIILPFEMTEDYQDMKYFPSVLSPTICKKAKDPNTGEEYLTFAGLTDASVSTENQGSIDRSNLMYAPDITYHLQEMMDRSDLGTKDDADIWLLTIHTEQVANANGSLYDNSYYQSLLYASYYNSLYGGGMYGYGGMGYGSYGYGSSYSNYYNYMMLAQMMAASQQQTYTTTTELDKDRFYQGILCGPNSTGRKPMFRVTFAIPKE